MPPQALLSLQLREQRITSTLSLLPGIGFVLLTAAPALHGEPSLLPPARIPTTAAHAGPVCCAGLPFVRYVVSHRRAARLVGCLPAEASAPKVPQQRKHDEYDHDNPDHIHEALPL